MLTTKRSGTKPDRFLPEETTFWLLTFYTEHLKPDPRRGSSLGRPLLSAQAFTERLFRDVCGSMMANLT